MTPFSFSHRKATQALNYFASHEGGSIMKLKALKLVYFADRYHLRRFGRPIIGDEYLAMNYGPVPSGTKDLAEMSEFLGEEEREYAKDFLRPEESLSFHSLQAVQEIVFSKSDLQALEWAWKTFGHHDRFALAEMTHQYPEWKRHQEAIQSHVISRAPMNYRDFLSDPAPGTDPCHPLKDEEREAVAEGIDELSNFQNLWR